MNEVVEKTEVAESKIICENCHNVLRKGTEGAQTEFRLCTPCTMGELAGKAKPNRFKSMDASYDFVEKDGQPHWVVQLLDYYKKPVYELYFTVEQLKGIIDVMEMEEDEGLDQEVKL